MCAGLVPLPALTQLQLQGFGAPTAGGLFGSSPVVLIGRASKALNQYFQDNGKLPQASAEIDETLKFVYKKLGGANPGPSMTSEKDFRVLSNVMMAVDSGLKNTSVEELRKKTPVNLSAAPGRLVIMITGPNQYMIWFSAADSKPAVDALGQAIVMHGVCSKDEAPK
jgi:hypothetical protein